MNLYPEHTINIKKTKFKFPCKLKDQSEKIINRFEYILVPSEDSLTIMLKPLSLTEGNEQVFLEAVVTQNQQRKTTCTIRVKRQIKLIHRIMFVAMLFYSIYLVSQGNFIILIFIILTVLVLFLQLNQINKGALILKENLEHNLPAILEIA